LHSLLWEGEAMEMTVTIEDDGKLILPETVCDRYRLQPGVPLRMIETQHGILLIPLTNTPMEPALAEELRAWQALGADSLSMFPYEDSTT
jgi:bifunctional DNA-binding transcriptional regulator/antitoxin component of YhaV-PrlF toxin-antitoxin module